MPWGLKTLSMKTCATIEALNECCKEEKKAYLQTWLTTTMMTNLFLSLGKPTIKSIEISIQIFVGIGKGCNYLKGFTISPLFLWHVPHSTEILVHMYFFMPSQKNKHSIHAYVL
jgi:hypothetical protein